MSAEYTIPAHIPKSLVRDFDFYNIPGADTDIHLAWKQLHESAPDIFWTPRNGGHWVATRAADIEEMQLDHTRFSHAKFNLPDFEFPFPPLPLSLDPPAHGPIRALLSPALSPRAVQGLSCTAREVAIKLIDELAPRGECEFVGQFAKVLPIVVFLDIVGLPFSDADKLMPHADALVRSTDIEQRHAAHAFIHQYLAGWIEKRRAEPGDDLLSKVVTAKVGGEPLSHAQVFGLATLALVGGLDTVVSMLSFTAKCLAENPHLRQQLRERLDDKAFLEHAVEELMRRHGLPNTARLITHDFEYKGVQFKQGDMIQLPKVLYNLDERKIPNPLEVDFQRPAPIPNATFGGGPHKCPGAMLARQEMRIFLEEWLPRVPDFSIRPGTQPHTCGGMVNAIHDLQLVWEVPSSPIQA